jgi:hypothetical protein
MNTTSWQIRDRHAKPVFSFFARWAAPAQAVLLTTLFFGCSPRVEHAKDEVFEQAYKIDPQGSLSVRNPHGSIAIHGTETDELRLRAVKKANSSEEMKGIDITAIGETNSVSITTKFLPQKNKPLAPGGRTVDYTIAIPPTLGLTRVDLEDGEVLIEGIRGNELRAAVVDGQLAIRSCCGNAQVTVANGGLDLFYERCDRPRFSVNAQITNGNARIFIRRGAPFHIQAETTTGKIINEFPDMVDLNGRALRKVDIFTGKGVSSEVKLRVTTGDIKIAEAQSDGSNPSQ